MKTLTKMEIESITKQFGIEADAITEAEEITCIIGDTVTRVMMVADKYGTDRDELLRKSIFSLMATSAMGSFKNYEIPERIKEFVERN